MFAIYQEKKQEEREEELEHAQADLRLAFKRIASLEAAMTDEMIDDDDESDSDDDIDRLPLDSHFNNDIDVQAMIKCDPR